VAAGSLSQLLDRPLGVKGVANPNAAAGGVDPQGPDSARAAIPIGARTLGRAVSVDDYADYALAFTGITKARADVLTLGSGRSIVVTVAGIDAAPPPGSTITDLAAALSEHGDPYVPIVVLGFVAVTFQLTATVGIAVDRVAADVLTAVQGALSTAFDFEQRSIGEPVFRSEVITTMQQVPGVLGVDLTQLNRDDEPVSLDARLIAAPATVNAAGAAIAAELITIATPVAVPGVMA
jgi:predicted phage baseplate assembly protein